MTDAPGWTEDWRTIWQSELAALAVDREAHEAVQRLAASWAGLHAALLPRLPDGTARPDAPARSAAAAAPPGDGDAARLAELVLQLERRVAELERGVADRA